MARNQNEPTEAVTTIGSQKITYHIRISKRARRLRLTVSGEQVSVTLPKGVPRCEAEKMVQLHSAWVLKQLARSTTPRKPQNSLPANVILLRGEAKRVDLIEEAERKSRLRIEETPDRLILRVPEGEGKKGRRLAVPWLKALARDEITIVALRWANRMGARFSSISIRDQKTRWGSCSSRGTLSFNWRLVMVPPAVLDYVVIHELAHLKQPNHSTAFWQVVAQYFPEYKKARSWLRANANLLRPADLL